MIGLLMAAALQAAAPAEDVPAAVAERSRLFETCFAKADAACLVDGYFVADELQPLASPPGATPPVQGRAALIAMYDRLFRDVVSIRLETLSLAASGELGHELGRSHLILRKGGTATGRYTVLWRKTPAGWRAQIDFIAADGWKP